MNKWYITKENRFLWTPGVEKVENVWVLGRLMINHGSSYVEARLEENGGWAAHHVYCVRHFNNILKVENELVEI